MVIDALEAQQHRPARARRGGWPPQRWGEHSASGRSPVRPRYV